MKTTQIRIRNNCKIKNATKTSSNGINFKSQLEKTIYNCLLELGFSPEYEPETYTLIEGFNPITPFYDKETDKQKEKRLKEGIDLTPSKLLVRRSSKIIGIRYTPDIRFYYNGIQIFIEVKGKENDVFYIKKKLFIKYLDNLYETKRIKSMYFEVYSKKQLLQVIDIIKQNNESK